MIQVYCKEHKWMDNKPCPWPMCINGSLEPLHYSTGKERWYRVRWNDSGSKGLEALATEQWKWKCVK